MVGGAVDARRIGRRVSPPGRGGQGNALNRSRLPTVLCVPLTSNLAWAEARGNTLLQAKVTGLAKDSVANASQLFAVDRSYLVERVRVLAPKRLAEVLVSIDIVLGR